MSIDTQEAANGLRHRAAILYLRLTVFVVAGLMLLMSNPARAQLTCSVTNANAQVNLGSVSSLRLASQEVSGLGGTGFACLSFLFGTENYVKFRVESSTFQLRGGPDNQAIPFAMRYDNNGLPVQVGSEYDLSAFSIFNFFVGPNGSFGMYFNAGSAPSIKSGVYTGTVNLRWYYAMCFFGALNVCIWDRTPGLTQNCFLLLCNGAPTNWGTGLPVTVTISLNVQNDCAITAPNVDFGSAPFTTSFNPVTQTLRIRCSAGTAYSVGMSNGNNYSGGSRRMRAGTTTNYLAYDIKQTPSSAVRWGPTGSERRSSASAETNPNVYDGVTEQGYTYRAVVNPNQPTPPPGAYTDRVVVDVQF